MQHMALGSQPPENLRRCNTGASVGAIQRDFHAGKGSLSQTDQIIHILIHCVKCGGHHPNLFRSRFWRHPLVVDDNSLNLLLLFVGKFETGAADDFDAVIHKRIMGSGEHDSRVGFQFPHQIGHRRRWHNAQHLHVTADRTKARCHGRFQHAGGQTGIPPDDKARLATDFFFDDRTCGLCHLHG